MNPVVHVGPGEGAVSADPAAIFAIYGLGSCVALAKFDLAAGVGGLFHVVLPSGRPTGDGEPAKYADLCVPWGLDRLTRLGARRERIAAKIAGGANLFGTREGSLLAVGERNVAAVREALRAAAVPIVAEDVGGTAGRSVVFHVGRGSLLGRVIGREAACI